MKSRKLRLLTIILIINFNFVLQAQQRWTFRFEFIDNEFGPVNTILYLESDANTFTMHSTKNADRRILGCPKATLARALKKMPKEGVLIRVTNGRIIPQNQDTDSLYSLFRIPMIGTMSFEGVKKSGKITGELYDNGQVRARLFGNEIKQSFRYDYTEFAQRIIDTTRKHIYDNSILEGHKWKKFEKKLTKIASIAADDVEMFFGVNLLSPTLPFTHFYLLLSSQTNENLLKESANGNVLWKEIDNKTAYVDIKSFGGESKEMDSVFLQILEHSYQNLIIDLRKNPGGGLQAGLAFGKYVCPKEINAGYFVTNKWFSKHKGDPNLEFDSFQVAKSITTDEFIEELKNSEGKKLIFTPGNIVFDGNIYVLTSHNTASTCEPIVNALKSNKLATIVGEKTAGVMLSAAPFYLKDNYTLMLPLADYYTADKKRLDQIGVEPNIKIDSDKALEHVLKILK